MSAVATDIDTGAVLSETELPRNCGYPALNRDSTRGMIVACTNRATVLVLQPDGAVVASEDFGLAGGFEPEITHRASIARPRLGFEAPDGSLGRRPLVREAAISATHRDVAHARLNRRSVASRKVGRTCRKFSGRYGAHRIRRRPHQRGRRGGGDSRHTVVDHFRPVFAVGDAVGFGPARESAGEFIAVRHDGSVEVLDFAAGVAGAATRQLVVPGGAFGTEVIP